MVRTAIKVFIMPFSIILIDVLIFVPIVLSVITIVQDLLHGKLDEPMEILEGVGVVLIGWGVAIEERPSLREIFHIVGGPREEIEAGIDTLCHSSGIGLLIFGLFAEIAVTAVRLPNHIIPTEGFDAPVLYFSTLLVVIGGYILAHHIVRMVMAMVWGIVPQSHAPRKPID
jgi:hypothetical protein